METKHNTLSEPFMAVTIKQLQGESSLTWVFPVQIFQNITMIMPVICRYLPLPMHKVSQPLSQTCEILFQGRWQAEVWQMSQIRFIYRLTKFPLLLNKFTKGKGDIVNRQRHSQWYFRQINNMHLSITFNIFFLSLNIYQKTN